MKLSFDDLEAEQGEVEPFELTLSDGSTVAFAHPDQIPARDLMNAEQSPADTVRLLVGDDSFEKLLNDERMSLGNFRVLFTKYGQHYGLATPGEGSASQRSSSVGSAGLSKRTSRRKG